MIKSDCNLLFREDTYKYSENLNQKHQYRTRLVAEINSIIQKWYKYAVHAEINQKRNITIIEKDILLSEPINSNGKNLNFNISMKEMTVNKTKNYIKK